MSKEKARTVINQIKLYDDTDSVFYVAYSDQITLQYDGDVASYTPTGGSETEISLVEANFDNDVLTMLLEDASSYPVNQIRVKTPPCEKEVVSYMQWTISGDDLVLALHIPARSTQEMTWEFGASAPPIKLKVKLKRNA